MKKHSVGWSVAKLLAKKVKFYKTLNVILIAISVFALGAVAFCLFRG